VERLEALFRRGASEAPAHSAETGLVEVPPPATATPVSSGEGEEPLPPSIYATGPVLLETSVPESGTSVQIPEGPAVIVPAGAFSPGVSLRVAKAEAAPVPLLAGEAPLLGAWKFDAGGGLFDKPVEMSLALPAVEDLSELRLVLPVTSRDGRDWTVLPYRRENNVLYFQATHFSIIGAILIGTLIGGGVVIPLVRAPTELPQYFQEDAPFVKFLAPDPEGINLSWSRKLGAGTPGLKDKAAVEQALQLAGEAHMQRVRDIAAMRDRELTRARRRISASHRRRRSVPKHSASRRNPSTPMKRPGLPPSNGTPCPTRCWRSGVPFPSHGPILWESLRRETADSPIRVPWTGT
jgi:hypothetical protein